MMLYLLHIEPHIEPSYKHVHHYLGYTEQPDVQDRIDQHLNGRGSPLIRAAVLAGCEIVLVRTWPDGDRHLERQLKNRGSSSRHCPRCRERWLIAARAAAAARRARSRAEPPTGPNGTGRPPGASRTRTARHDEADDGIGF